MFSCLYKYINDELSFTYFKEDSKSTLLIEVHKNITEIHLFSHVQNRSDFMALVNRVQLEMF